MRYRDPIPSDWSTRIFMVLLYIDVVALGAFFVFPQGSIGKIFFALIAAGGLFWLAWWHLRSIGFRCGECEHEFDTSLMTKLTSPHGIVWYELRCPECRRRTRAKVLIKEG